MTTPDEARVRDVATMGRAGILSGVGSIVSGLANLLIIVVVARWYGQNGAGVFATITAVANIGYQVGRFGIDTALVRLIPVYIVRGERARVPSLLRYMSVAALAVGSGVGATIVVAAPTLNAMFVTGDRAATAALVAVGATLPIGCLAIVLAGACRGLGDIRWLVLGKRIVEPLLKIMAVIAAVALGASVAGAAIAWILPGFVTVALLGTAVRRLTPDRAAREPLLSDHHRELRRFTGPRAVAGIVEVLGLHASVLLVSALAGVEAAGVFAVATRILLFGDVVLNAIAIAMAPLISRLHAQAQQSAIAQLYSISTGWIIASSWGFLGLIALHAGDVMALVGGDTFRVGGASLSILAVAMMIYLGTGPAQTILLMSGGSTATLIIAAGSLLGQILLCFALVPSYGITGGAIAKGLAVCAENIAVVAVIARQLQVRLEAGALIQPMAIAALSALAGESAYHVAPAPAGTVLGLVLTSLTAVALSLLRGRALQLDLVWRRGTDYQADELTGPVRSPR